MSPVKKIKINTEEKKQKKIEKGMVKLKFYNVRKSNGLCVNFFRKASFIPLSLPPKKRLKEKPLYLYLSLSFDANYWLCLTWVIPFISAIVNHSITHLTKFFNKLLSHTSLSVVVNYRKFFSLSLFFCLCVKKKYIYNVLFPPPSPPPCPLPFTPCVSHRRFFPE